MFCFNCGEKVIDGAKFCSNCGTNLSEFLVYNDVRSDIVTSEVTTDEETSNWGAEYNNLLPNETKTGLGRMVQIEFNNIFKPSLKKTYGNMVYIMGRDDITQEMRDKLQNYYLQGSQNEKTLLIFDYDNKKTLKYGLVLTDQRLIWQFLGIEKQEIELTKIKNIRYGKSGLASVLRVTSIEDVVYKEIYLTGIEEEIEFVAKLFSLRENIYENVYLVGQEDYLDDTVDDDFIVNACNFVESDGLCYEWGNPLTSMSSKKYNSAKKYFEILDDEDDENIYLICDATIIGNCKKGFAITTYGIYYCDDSKKVGYFAWKQFKDKKISYKSGVLKIGDAVFILGGSDAKKMTVILKCIQEYLKTFL